jgi:hypothetical protein
MAGGMNASGSEMGNNPKPLVRRKMNGITPGGTIPLKEKSLPNPSRKLRTTGDLHLPVEILRFPVGNRYP